MCFYSSVYSELILIGETNSLKNKDVILKNFPIGSSEPWKLYNSTLTTHYSPNELISLFKGLVICEKELQWHCGSTTPAAHLYQDIKNLGLDPDHSLADWAFQFSENEYIPYGFIRHGEKTAYEYLQWRENFHKRVYQERISKEERKRLQLERAKKIAEEKKERDADIHDYYSRVMGLTPREQVDVIISDQQHLFYFYMPIIDSLLNRKDITTDDLEKLLFKLEDMKETPFRKKVANRIVEKLQSLI